MFSGSRVCSDAPGADEGSWAGQCGPFSVTFVDEFSNEREASIPGAAKHGV